MSDRHIEIHYIILYVCIWNSAEVKKKKKKED